jgi:hypothetical protein
VHRRLCVDPTLMLATPTTRVLSASRSYLEKSGKQKHNTFARMKY